MPENAITSSASDGPWNEYRLRLENRNQAVAKFTGLHRTVGRSRLSVFAIGLLLTWFAFGFEWISWYWILLPVAVFAVLVIWHERVSRHRRRAERAASFYERGLARPEGRWMGTGEPGTRFIDEMHPYALDLDILGKGSLFELISTARTRRGEEILSGWLLHPSKVEEILQRQDAVAELRDRLDLREDLAVLGDDLPASVHLDVLLKWAEAPRSLDAPLLRWTALTLSICTVLGAFIWLGLRTSVIPLAAILLVEAALAAWLSRHVNAVVEPIERRARDLSLFASLLARLEAEPCRSARLTELKESLKTGGRTPSERIAELTKLIDWLNAKRNQLFAPIAPLLMWTTQLAFLLEAWRAQVGPVVRRWLDAVGEFEAICSLAGYSSENPQDPFPEVVPDGPLLQAVEIGHPLLPLDRCVRNSVELSGQQALIIVSGSNMSGKSTLLRTVGVNVVLALAGAPVRAARLRVSPLMVGSTLRIQDSLQAGRSRFFAEITRIRQLLDLAREKPPLLFLLDEILHGTNSHDRRLGAEAIVGSLLARGAVGFVTTHDLALTHLDELFAPRAINVHFEDHFENGAMTFDYKMRQGVVQKSNALELMRAVGIEVSSRGQRA